MLEGLKHAYETGGWPMYVNTALLAVVIAIIIERFKVLFMDSRRLHKVHFMTQVTGFITRGDYRRAITYCDAMPAPLTRVVKAGLIAAPKSDAEAQAAMDEASLRELPKLEMRTGYLAMLGNVATLIGLFGTILGLIHAFASVANADPAEKASLLAKSISEAMSNTALGLGIAIPALMFFSFFQGRTQHVVDDINEVAVTVLNLVTNNRKQLRNLPKDEVAAG
jgi:biopolymer transport protein ExbB/TolQ